MKRLYTDALFQKHETGSHPENSSRLKAIDELPGWPEGAERGTIRAARDEEILAVHTRDHLETITATAGKPVHSLDPDTLAGGESQAVARAAAGTACDAVHQVVSGTAQRALCLIRPPGHHALPDRAMGFCLYNNVAIAARFAQREMQLERILIIDWDVHHGNGTQDMFYEDSRVFYLSLHRAPFYPGTGAAHETGTGDGLGTTLNVPVAFGTSRQRYHELFAAALETAVAKSRPELILISAGFDAHRSDPIGSLGLETEDFGLLTDVVVSAADAECRGRIVSLLEGGYHPQALAESVKLHWERL